MPGLHKACFAIPILKGGYQRLCRVWGRRSNTVSLVGKPFQTKKNLRGQEWRRIGAVLLAILCCPCLVAEQLAASRKKHVEGATLDDQPQKTALHNGLIPPPKIQEMPFETVRVNTGYGTMVFEEEDLDDETDQHVGLLGEASTRIKTLNGNSPLVETGEGIDGPRETTTASDHFHDEPLQEASRGTAPYRTHLHVRQIRPRAQWSIGISAGGYIHQQVLADLDPSRSWDQGPSTLINVQILNSVAYGSLTFMLAPPTPIDANTYLRQGIPFYELFDERNPAVSGAAIQSVGDFDAED